MTLLAHSIYHGDCIERLGDVPSGSVDLVFADPPFNIGYDYDVYEDQKSSQDYLSWCGVWMSAVHQVLKPTGSFWLAIGDEYAAELKLLAQQQAGFHCRSWVIWYYTFGVNCVRGFSRSHTHLFHFVKDPNKFTFNERNPAVRVLSARQLVYADGRANSKGRLPDNTWILRPQDAPTGFRPTDDTWYFARVAGTFKEREGFHGCQMPEQLLGRIIRTSSCPRDLVLDPFAGSGTTLVVAKKLGRRWLGIELSADYVKSIRKRLGACRSGDELDGPEDPVRSAPRTSQGKRRTRLRKGRSLPLLDEDTERGIVAAYTSACRGHSTDFVLCDPEVNGRFVDACKQRSLLGDAYTWNRLLLRIRKAGKLPRGDRVPQRLNLAEMDSFSFASEIAMQLLSIDYGLTVDELFCSPITAGRFDELAAEFAAGYTPFQYRWAAMTIRKRARKAKELAHTRFSDWLDKPLPRRISSVRATSEDFQCPGVYVVYSHRQPLYVGETQNLANRIERMLETRAWLDLDPQSIRIVSRGEQDALHGLQSILIQRTNPLFNSRLLRADANADRPTAAV